MKPNPKTEIDAAIRDAGRVPGWNLRTAPPIRRFRLGDCLLIVVPVRVFADRRKWPSPNIYEFPRHGDAA